MPVLTEPSLFPEVVEEEGRRQERHTSTMMKAVVPAAFAILGAAVDGFGRTRTKLVREWAGEAKKLLKSGEVDEAGAVRFLARALIFDLYGEDADHYLGEAKAFLEHLARTL